MLIEKVCDLLMPATAARSVSDIRVGLGYTAVQLDDGGCGLAYTFRSGIDEGVVSSAKPARWWAARPQSSPNGPGRPIRWLVRWAWQRSTR